MTLRSELIYRIISAVILAALALFLSYYNAVTFAFLLIIGVAIVSWEWGAITRGKTYDLIYFLHMLGAGGALVFLLYDFYAIGLVLLGLTALLTALPALHNQKNGASILWAPLGVVYTGLAVMSLLWLRQDANYGWAVILFLFLVVWGADSAAYFSGRLIGGPKLMPRVSPKKTWAGFLGGLAASAVIGLLFSLYLGKSQIWSLALMAMILAIACQIGDLAESAIKRKFDVKDSSQLIPGHGGLFDRVDGLMAAALLACAIGLLHGGQEPGRAILFW